MKILLINGSPKGKKSNSLRLAASFVEGVKSTAEGRGEEVTVDEVEVVSLKISACRGCFACWKNTPGQCCIKDDMAAIIEKEIEADLVVWSFPLYYFNVPGIVTATSCFVCIFTHKRQAHWQLTVYKILQNARNIKIIKRKAPYN